MRFALIVLACSASWAAPDQQGWHALLTPHHAQGTKHKPEGRHEHLRSVDNPVAEWNVTQGLPHTTLKTAWPSLSARTVSFARSWNRLSASTRT